MRLTNLFIGRALEEIVYPGEEKDVLFWSHGPGCPVHFHIRSVPFESVQPDGHCLHGKDGTLGEKMKKEEVLLDLFHEDVP